MAEKKETDLQKIKELIDIMIANNLVEVEIVDGNNKIVLKRPQPQRGPTVTAVPMVAAAAAAQQKAADEDDGLVDVISPMVGTFYAAPSPDSEPCVQVGSEVSPETVVCIIEAMKVMNEIKADTDGTIARIMVANGQAVEYGQVLFKVKPF